jgi:hypothetical protein
MSTKPLVASRDELIDNPAMQRPHVVILGAGASVAACPHGDNKGRLLPTMDNLVEILALGPILKNGGIKNSSRNFEVLYSSLYSDPQYTELRKEIESEIDGYFSTLELPDYPTVYDHLLLSLRKKDAVFTFNWDPFLYDAAARNRRFNLPEIFFLHGNVRAGAPTKLLYPIETKDYTTDSFIASQWESARWFLENAFTLTIFGYGAPTSDVEAVKILKDAWDRAGQKIIERVEIIDIKSRYELYETWKPFISHYHYDSHACFYESYIAKYPRRSGEALYAPTAEGRPAEQFPIPRHLGFDELFDWLEPIAQRERAPMSRMDL